MIFNELPLKDAYIIRPTPFEDHRGKFSRLFCQNELKQIGHHKEIVQINHSITKQKGAVRGMHFQKPPRAEIKIVKCINGSVFDVIVDLRKNSSTFLQWHGEILSAENMKMMYVPEGFAHGFQTLENNVELLYFHTEFYDTKYESGLKYDDPMVNISWKLEPVDLSLKDQNYPLFSEGITI